VSKEKILKAHERVKWFLWHGHVFRADETLTDLKFEVDGAIEEDNSRCDGPRRERIFILQVRVQALNDDLRASFERWYPDLRHSGERTLAAHTPTSSN
jgi:hypothetical protein